MNGAVDATQEMISLSLCNLVGSTVQSMPTTGAFTRSAVASASGIRTPLANLYAGNGMQVVVYLVGVRKYVNCIFVTLLLTKHKT